MGKPRAVAMAASLFRRGLRGSQVAEALAAQGIPVSAAMMKAAGRDAVRALLAAGASYRDIEAATGLDKTVAWQLADQRGMPKGSRPGPRTFTDAVASRFLAGLRTGLTLKDACARAGVPRSTMVRARRIDPEFDEAVVAAAAAGGRVLSYCGHLTCPGDLCGTTSGYASGCSAGPCRAAATAARAAARAKRWERA